MDFTERLVLILLLLEEGLLFNILLKSSEYSSVFSQSPSNVHQNPQFKIQQADFEKITLNCHYADAFLEDLKVLRSLD